MIILNEMIEGLKLLENSVKHEKQYKNLFGTCGCRVLTEKNLIHPSEGAKKLIKYKLNI